MPNALDNPASDTPETESPAFRGDLGSEVPELMGPQTNNEMDAVVRAVQTLQAIGNSLSPATQVGRELAGATAQPQPDPAQANYGRMMSGPLDPSEAGIPDLRYGQSTAPTGIDAGPAPTAPRADIPSAIPGGDAGEAAVNPKPTTAEELAGYQSDKIGDVQSEMDKAYIAHTAYMQAKLAAERSHADAEARAHEDAVTEQQLLNARTERETAMIEAKADADMSAHYARLDQLSKQEPNPARWWDNQDGLGKALWAMSLVFSSAYVALTPGAKNTALEMVKSEIARDVAAQEARQRRDMAIEEMKGGEIRRKETRNLSDTERKHTREYTRIMALERAWVARAAAPNDLDAQAMKQEGIAYLASLRLPIAMQQRTEAVAAARAQLQMKHDREMQAALLGQQTKENELNRQLQRDLAKIEVSAKASGPKYDESGRLLDKEGLPLLREAPASSTGGNVVVKDRTTGQASSGLYSKTPGVAVFREDKGKQAFEDANKIANEKYDKMTRLSEALGRKSGVSRAAGVLLGETDPEIEKLLIDVGYANAKAIEGRVSNSDFDNQVRGVVAYSPDGKTLDRLKHAVSFKDIKRLVDEDIKRMPAYVGEGLSTYLDNSLQGNSTVTWKPSNLRTPEVRARNQNEVEGRPNITFDQAPVTGVKDYNERRNIEANDNARTGQVLPPHEADKVEAALSAVKGRGPDGVRAEATRILNELDGEEQALSARFEDKPAAPGSPVTRPGTAETPTDEDKARLQEIRETKKIVQAVTADAAKRAEQTLKNFEGFAKTAYWLSTDELRAEARKPRFDLTEAPADVDAALKRAIEARKKAGDGAAMAKKVYGLPE